MAATLALAACASVPDLGARPAPRAAATIASGATVPPGAAAWPAPRWWDGYGDAQLGTLIEEGLANAPDIAIARARLLRAQGLAQQAGAALRPSLEARGSAGVIKQSYNNGIPRAFLPQGIQDTGTLSLSADFDLDLWGGARAARRAALSDEQAARIDGDAARLSLSTAVGAAYADLAQQFADRDVAELTLRIRRDTLRLVDNRVRSGLDTQGQLRQAAAGVPEAQESIAALDEAIALTRNRLAALVGAGPDRGLAIARPRIAVPAAHALPPGIALDLVGRRPDIAAARARADAASERIRTARADFYPNVNLSALVGLQALGLENVLKRGSTYGNAGPAFSLPIFDGGRIAGRYRGARADYDEAVSDYDRTLLQAVREVADAVASRRALDDRLADARRSLADNEAAFHIAQLRYEGGLSTYLDVLSAEQALIGSRRLAADLGARIFTLDVALVRALGGGFTGNGFTGGGSGPADKG